MAAAVYPKVRTITVSATYGAGGSVIAPRLAERVGLRFLDRLVRAGIGPERSAERPECGEGLNDEERAQTPLSRWWELRCRGPRGSRAHRRGHCQAAPE
jgi:hypothetical protein